MIIYKTGKWQLIWYFGVDHNTRERGWRIIRFGIIKIHTIPKEGYLLDKHQYHGFMFAFRLWLPIERY